MPMPRTKKWSTLQLAKAIARLADEFVIAEGKNKRHINTVAEFVATELKKDGIHRVGGTPMHDENWVLLDFGPVVLHVFNPKSRAFYDLENLWGDCKRIRWQAPVRKAKAADAAPTA
jgi:ribosome-associated protein